MVSYGYDAEQVVSPLDSAPLVAQRSFVLVLKDEVLLYACIT